MAQPGKSSQNSTEQSRKSNPVCDQAASKPASSRKSAVSGQYSATASAQTDPGSSGSIIDSEFGSTNRPVSNEPTSSINDNQNLHNQQWLLAAAADVMRQRVAEASDQLNNSMRQLYNSASSITEAAATSAVYLTAGVQGPPPPAYQNIPGVVPYFHGRASGPPPSYEDVVNPFSAPPTYQSLFGQMREARKSSRTCLDLLKKVLIILLSTLGCTILIALMILVPFTMIIVGAVYIDDCRVEHIPAFLLVGGIVWASKNILHCYCQCQKIELQANNYDPNGTNQWASFSQTMENMNQQQSTAQAPTSGSEPNSLNDSERPETSGQHRFKSSICESLLNCVLIGWFIAGCIIVFRNYEPDFENIHSARYCNRIVYMYTFWLINSAIIVFMLFISCICCLMFNSILTHRQNPTTMAELPDL